MKHFNSISRAAAAAVAFMATAAFAAPKVGMYIGYESTDNDNPQESVAAKWFQETFEDGVVIAPSQVEKIDATEIEALWIHIDRVGIGSGCFNLPLEFKNEQFCAALKQYVIEGGNVYLSKFATQLLGVVGRVDDLFAPGIFGDGDGGDGTDVWCVNAHLGSWQINPDNPDQDPTQVYDHRSHPIYAGLETFEPWSVWGNFPHSSYPMLGSGDGSPLHREDHNCMWDLNSYSFDNEGKNTLEQFEQKLSCEVIGTWGHVQDYCVAGIVDFAPTEVYKGRIVANGLAACEWAPRTGVNKYHGNLELLTKNTLNYLAPASTGVTRTETSASADAVYFNLQGVKVDNPSKGGIFIKVQDGKTVKVVF